MNKRVGGIILAAVGGTIAIGAAIALTRPASTVEVDTGPVGERIVARATVVPSAGVRRVYAAADGRVVRVLVREGETVAAGQRLVDLESGGQTRVLEAPQRGVILVRNCEVGDYALAAERGGSQPLFELADPAQTELRVEVEEADAARLAVGQSVHLSVRGRDGARVPGQVSRVSARLERRTIGADDSRVRADGLVRVAAVAWRGNVPDWPLGTRAEAVIEVRKRDAAARIPRAALSVRDGRTVVALPQLFWTREVPVEIVSADDAYAEIRGLSPGTEVVVPAE
jgi:multidrug efflux pump subunit AcrA (membrane-fusion protein)